jgi:quercetin dioxygenase-like cupin family protein
MSVIEYIRIFADPEGESHFEKGSVGMASNSYAPPAPPLDISAPESAEAIVFLHLPVGWYGDWHPSPVSQYLIVMTGACLFETGDGKVFRGRAGDVVLLDDTTGKGHRTRVIGDSAMTIAAVHLPPTASPSSA